MSSKIRYITYLLSLVLSIYILRQTDLSPSNFLSHQITRITEEEQLSASVCAGGYDGITVSASQKTSADSYRTGFRNMRGDKSLSSFIANDEPIGTFVMDYSKTYLPYLMPWAIFFVIALVGWLTYSCNWCFMYVPPLKRRVWNCCRRPKTPRFKNLFVILSSLFMLFSIGGGVAGITLMSKFKTYTYGTECSTVKFIEDIQQGSEEDKWIGVATAIDVLDAAVNNITETIDSTSIYDTLLAKYNQDLNAMLTTLNDLYTQFQGRSLDRISPSGGTYQPMYITELGPVDQSGTALNAIAAQLNGGFDILSSNQASLNEFRASATQDTDSTIESVMSNRPVLVTANDTLTYILNQISDHQSLIKTVINVSNGAVKGLFIANLSIGAAAILAILLVCFGARVFNKGIHLSWCLLGFLTIVGWAIATGLFATTLLVAEGCDVANLALTNPLFFNQTFDKIAHAFNVNNQDTDDTRNILYRCVFGDGDLASQFNLTSNLAMFDPIFTKINQISIDTTNSINSLPTGLAAEAQGLLDKFVTGYYPDSVETVTDLVELNLVTNSALNPCTSVQDQWALNLVNCTGQTVFQPDSPVDFNVGGSTCIPYDNWAAQPRDINLRYTSDRFSGFLCLSMNDRGTAVGFIDGLIRNRDETQQLLAEMGQQVNVLDGQFTSFVTALQETPQMLKQTNASVDMIYMALADNNTGLIANANCQYIVQSAWELVDVGCGGAGIVIFQSTVAFLVMSFVALFGTLFLFCLAKRFIVEKPYKKTDPRLYAKDTSIRNVKNKVTVD